jgi:hypothetical protein
MPVSMSLLCQFFLNGQIIIIISRLILLTIFICTSVLKLIVTSSKHGLLQREMKAESKCEYEISEKYDHIIHTEPRQLTFTL